MFSKIFLWAFFFDWMPQPRRLTIFGPRFVLIYGGIYERYKKSAIIYHRYQLLRLSINNNMSEANPELPRQGETDLKEGTGPLGSEYTELEDVV